MNLQNKNKQHWGSCTEHQVSIKPDTEGKIHQELVPSLFKNGALLNLMWQQVLSRASVLVRITMLKNASKQLCNLAKAQLC